MSTIRDKILDPFYVKKDQYCYTVMEVITPTSYREDGGKGKDYEKTVGYFPTLDLCLERIGKEKLNLKGSEYNSIEEYIETYREILKEMRTLTKHNL